MCIRDRSRVNKRPGNPVYSPGSVYSKKGKKKSPKRYDYEATIFDGSSSLGEIGFDKVFQEKVDLNKICSGGIVLYEDFTESKVFKEIADLCCVGLGRQEDVNFHFLKREGKKKAFKRHVHS